MPLTSMTGCGAGSVEADGMRIEVEISAVNRKQFDLRVNLPRPFSILEAQIAKCIRGVVSRGSLTVNVRVIFDPLTSVANVKPDLDLAKSTYSAYQKIRDVLGIEEPIPLASVLQCPELLMRDEKIENRPARVWIPMQKALDQALSELEKMRRTEGRALQRDIEKRLALLRRRHAQVARLAPMVPKRYAKGLRNRIAELMKNTPVDAGALAHEVALAADRCDITEELVRLESHFAMADACLVKHAPQGRTLDFLCQELLREINTIGSKSGDIRITRKVIELKSELDRLREQIQNIE